MNWKICERWKDRKALTQEMWLETRRQGIGGSDAGAVAGFNPYHSALSVYYDKVGLGTVVEATEIMRQGNDLEVYVADRFCEMTGKRVKRCEYVLRSKAYPFMLADVDRVVVGENALLECKTTLNRDRYTFECNDYPFYWKCQCLHYMAVTGADRVYLTVLEFGRTPKIITIERSACRADIEALIQIEKTFWEENVMKQLPPAPDGSEASSRTLERMFPQDSEECGKVDLMPCAETLIQLGSIRREIARLTEQKEACENLLKAALGEAASGEYGGYRVTWKTRESRRLDTQAMKREVPGMYEKYCRVSTARTFNFYEKN